MKTNHHHVDDILRAWAQRQTIDPERLERVRHTARDRIAAERQSPHQARKRCRHVALPGAIALAAALLIIARIWTPSDPQRPEKSGICVTDSGDSGRLLSNADSIRAAVLADSLQQLFANEWRWVAQSDGNIEIETLMPDAMTDRKTPQSALVRFVVMTRPRGEKNWQKAWETDVLMRSEDFLDFKPDPALDNRLQLWVYPLEDGKVAVDTGIALERPIQVTTQAQNLVNQGKPVEILALTTDAAEYRVMQEVVILKLFEG